MALSWFRTRSLMNRFVLQASFTFIVCSITLGGLSMYLMLSDRIDERYQYAQNRVESIAAITALALYNVDLEQAESILQGFQRDLFFERVELLDIRQQVIKAIEPDHPPHNLKVAQDLLTYALSSHPNEITQDLLYHEKLNNHTRKVYVGTIRLTISNHISDDTLIDTFLSTLGIVVIELCILTLILIRLFKRDISQPIERIAAQLQQEWPPQEGHVPNPLPVPIQHKHDELGKLVFTFNKAIDLTYEYFSLLRQDTAKATLLSKTDPLTGAYNQRAIEHKLDAIRHDDPGWMVAQIDVDSFAQFNDSFGQDRGDVALIKVYQQLQALLPDNTFIARLTGGTFVVMHQADQTKEALLLNLQKATSLSLSEEVVSSEYTLTMSIGVFWTDPIHNYSARKILNNANVALKEAKNSGRQCVRTFDNTLADNYSRRQATRIQLLDVIKTQRITLAYQPKINMETYEIVGCEVLLRLPSQPDRAPFELIQYAEQSGLIVSLGSLIFERACQELAQLKPHLPEGFTFSINASSRQLASNQFQENFQEIAHRYQIDMKSLDIEITETSYLHDTHDVGTNFRWLLAQGCQLSIDDFGTGFSSLEYLLKAGFDQIKLDCCFVRQLPHDQKSKRIVQGILHIAELFQLKVVAEGVENELQEKWLLKEGVSIAQGYLYSKPVSLDKFQSLLQDGAKLRSTL